MSKQIFLLGPDTPEMREIARVAKRADHTVQYAMHRGQRVHPGNANEADALADVKEGDVLVCIACRPRVMPKKVTMVYIDHTQSRGSRRKPGDFWTASSVGQVYARLSLRPSQAVKVLAAMAYCFDAAMRDECSGVSRDEVLECKVREIAATHGVSTSEVQARIQERRRQLNSCQSPVGLKVIDARKYYLGEGYSLDLLCMQVAVSLTGKAALLRHRDRVGEPEKVSLTGNVTSELLRFFVKEWAQSEGLKKVYSNVERGYAGGYVTK